MRKPEWKTLLKYGIAAAANLLFAAVYFFGHVPMSRISETVPAELARHLCDAFFVPGMLTLLTGLLMWVASEGALDGISYLGSCLVKTLIPGKHGGFERYGDYLERKRETRKKGGMGFLCIVGLVFVLISCIFLARFNSLS